MYHFKTWVHVLVDHGGRVGFKNVTMYSHCERELDFAAKFVHIPKYMKTYIHLFNRVNFTTSEQELFICRGI